jgi:2'-5' RNA ligase
VSANPPSIRIFTALELPAAVLRRLAAVIEALMSGMPRGSVRWARPEGLHLTLQFYGEVDPARVPALQAALTLAATAVGPLTLDLAGRGAFPNSARARVLWVGVGGDLEGLRRLQRSVEAAGQPLGFEPDERGFNPHLTLGRVNQPLRPAGGRQLAEVLARTTVPAGAPFTLAELSLMRSELRAGGSVYTRLSAAPLGGGRNI